TLNTATLSTATLTIGIIIIVAAYLIGSLSSAVIYCKIFKLPDPRTQGSGNPGATNVMRIAGKGAAVVVLLGDVLKGAIPVLLAKLFELNPWFIGLTALAAFLGHLYPIFFRFEGGKGVATAVGICLALSWPFGLAVSAIWLFTVAITRVSSLGALAASGAAPVLAYILIDWQIAVIMILIALLIAWKHQGNIQRLREGTEPKIGEKASSNSSSENS
ncbi:MAG: glycerol-3-phosphate 1-O-acyltransferase PlsY, partial [Gammaproteobacteria bacterium]